MIPTAYVVHFSREEKFAVLADRLRTGGTLGIVACTWSAGAEPPPHTMIRSDRALIVTAGVCRVRIDGDEYVARRDDLVFVPRGARLTVRVDQGACRVIVVVAPAGAEAWISMAVLPDLPPDVALGVAMDHGVEVHPR